MPATYEPISSTTLTNSTTNTLTFSSIPSTYTDLILVVNGCITVSDNVAGFRVNSDSGTNYSQTGLRGTSSAAVSFRESNQSQLYLGWYPYPRSNAQASVETGNMIVHFMNYANTTTYKSMLVRSNTAYGDSGTNANIALWRSTAAISSITVLLTATGTPYFTSGTMFTLYGVKAA